MYQENIIDMLMQKMIRFNQNDPQPVSYTHLTLPTIA